MFKKLKLILIVAILVGALFGWIVFLGSNENPFRSVGVRGGFIELWFLYGVIIIIGIVWILMKTKKKRKDHK